MTLNTSCSHWYNKCSSVSSSRFHASLDLINSCKLGICSIFNCSISSLNALQIAPPPPPPLFFPSPKFASPANFCTWPQQALLTSNPASIHMECPGRSTAYMHIPVPKCCTRKRRGYKLTVIIEVHETIHLETYLT